MDAAKTKLASKTALLLVAALAAAVVPAQAQLQVSTNTVTPSNQQASTFGVSSGSSTGAQITFTVVAIYGNGQTGWFRVLNAQGASVIGSSPTTQANGPVILYVQIAIANPGAGTSGSIVLADTSNSADTQTVAVNYVPNSSGTVSASPASVAMSTFPVNGAQVFTTVQLSTTSATTIGGSLSLANSTTAYLSLSTNSFSVSSAFPTSFNVIGGAYTPAGSYSANIQVTPTGGQTLSIPVSYTSTSGTSANPSAFTLNYPAGPTAQTVTVTSSGTQFYSAAISANGWLLVNGASSTGYQASNSAITVSVNSSVAAGLPAGNYTGQVNVYATDGTTAAISVTLSVTVTTGVAITPSTVSFSVPAGTPALQAYTVNLTTSSLGVNYTASTSVTSGGNWLSLSLYSATLIGGNVNNALSFYVNPSGLAAGTYYGTVTLSYTGGYIGSAQIPVTVVVGASGQGLKFYPVTPCRVVDTRSGNGPYAGPILNGGTTRNFNIAGSSCGIPSAAQAFSLNVTVVPAGPLNYLTAWPAGLAQPLVSTLNSLTGAIVANGATVPSGTGANTGSISIYVSDTTHLILDINGYYAP